MKNKRLFHRLLVAGLLIVAAVAVTGIVTYYKCCVSSYNGPEKWIFISADATENDIRTILSDSIGTIGSRAADLYHLTGAKPARSHGAYRITDGTTALKLYRTISRGAQTPIKVTFNNVRTVNQLASRIASRMELDSASFMTACDSVLPPRGFNRATYPAAFLPDSYEFYWTTPAASVVKTLADYRDRFWNDDRRAKASALGLNPVGVATIASIAEEETNDRAERGTVGRLYINRLKRGMPLQADPTVKFAVGDFGLRRITSAHLNTSSPYNTYRVTGLPPGPIRIADRATLEAVLDSKPHPYLYMCAKEDFSGRHNFATDLATHQANARRYHNALNRRNIK